MSADRRTVFSFSSVLFALFIAASATAQTTIGEPFGAQVPPRDGSCPGADWKGSGDACDNPQIAPAISVPPGPQKRPFLIALGFVPLATFVGAKGSQPSDVLYPRDRFAIAQIVGGGYVVNPRFRFGAVAIFNEALTGLPPGASAWQSGGVAPVAIGTPNRFIIGGGPVFSYRSGGGQQSGVGAVVITGVSIPVRKGLAVNIVAPVTALFTPRTTASMGVAVGMARVF